MNKLVSAAAIALAGGLAHADPVIYEVRKLTIPEAQPTDRFGQSVAAFGDIAAVAAPQKRWDPSDPTDPPRAVRGTVDLFNLQTGEHLSRLTSPNAPIDFQPFGFGYAIDFDGEYVVVGSPDSSELGERSGSAHVFDAVTHEHLHTLIAADGAQADFFGYSVAVDQGIVVVGSPNAGAAYVFDAATGKQISKLLPDPVDSIDRFGRSVSIHDSLIAVGAPGARSFQQRGAVYFFQAGSTEPISVRLGSDEYGTTLDVNNGITIVAEEPYQSFPTVRLVLPDRTLRVLGSNGPRLDAQFGKSVAIDEKHALIAATARTDVDPELGEIQVYDAQTGRWIIALRASDLGTAQFSFASPVAVHDGIAVVGSPYDNAAYVYDLPDLCPADFATAHAQLDFFDVVDFLQRFNSEDFWADLAPPQGTFDSADLAAFLNAYLSGCP